ncbi:MAG: 50S ribosomal protein L21 [Candidatus Omnitrophica bacterium]|nr:50S ribosomal protein L21 [Candidatus Omnitrophota bacterium]MBU4488011.1 50S ribosomal protein L21 [Candidatus Omnitrophota bacterium]MCG2704747.1 50S ribosomal protein L21 [Candidatus Omnitrophota bacterium]
MEYAIVEVGGNQFKVKKGDVIKAGKFTTDSKKSAKINKVLLYSDGKSVEIGSPYIKGAHIACDIIGEEKAKKVIAYKYRRRKSSKFKKGHRRKLLVLKVKDISIKGD